MTSADQLKTEILTKVVEYYHKVHAPQQHEPFLPGTSHVNYAGRVFDERELVNLVDASLDFWLTYGNYSQKSCKEVSHATEQVLHQERG